MGTTQTTIFNKRGDKFVYSDGALHNRFGPAVKYANGDCKYYLFGKLHRTNGPAINIGGEKLRYFIHGREYTWVEFLNLQTYGTLTAVNY